MPIHPARATIRGGGTPVIQPFAQPVPGFQLWSWGYNKNGELGIGVSGAYGSPYYSRYTPVQVGMLTSWTTMYASYSECFARRKDGTLWGWGRNAHGQLGVGDIVPRSVPTQIVGNLTTWTRRVIGGSDAGTGGLTLAPNPNPNLISKAYMWGQIFDPILQQTYVSSPHQLGARTDWQDFMSQEQFFMGMIGGRMYGWGNNDHYQLGLGFKSPLSPDVSSPTQVGTSSNWLILNKGWGPFATALQTDRTLWGWGLNQNSGMMGTALPGNTRYVTSPVQISTDKSWKQVVTGYIHVLGIDTNNYLWSWGYNNLGQCGNGTHTPISSPVQIGSSKWKMVSAGKDHSVGITMDGKFWAWGANNYGKLGNGQHGIPNTNPFLNSQSSPVQVGSATTWTWCAASKYNSFGMRT